MKIPYRTTNNQDPDTNELAKLIVAILVDSEVTYQQADDALTVAQELLLSGTRPVVIEAPAQAVATGTL